MCAKEFDRKIWKKYKKMHIVSNLSCEQTGLLMQKQRHRSAVQ